LQPQIILANRSNPAALRNCPAAETAFEVLSKFGVVLDGSLWLGLKPYL
jgi:hypothetical protein